MCRQGGGGFGEFLRGGTFDRARLTSKFGSLVALLLQSPGGAAADRGEQTCQNTSETKTRSMMLNLRKS
ncbi:MAG TPA: hypothetical protein VEN28_03555 [Burkholderiaceae bacterium]|nr:hypothetical protein [Burkholderiaceae bacterium]